MIFSSGDLKKGGKKQVFVKSNLKLRKRENKLENNTVKLHCSYYFFTLIKEFTFPPKKTIPKVIFKFASFVFSKQQTFPKNINNNCFFDIISQVEMDSLASQCLEDQSSFQSNLQK